MDETQNQAPVGAPAPQSKKKLIIIAVVVVVLLIVVQSLLSSLFSPERATERLVEKMLEDATGGSVDIDADGAGSLTITDEDGSTIEISGEGEGKLPADWPNSVPLLSDASIEYGGTVQNGEGRNLTVVYATKQSVQEAARFYADALGKNGWAVEANLNTGDGAMISATQGENTTAVAYITEGDGGASVSVNVTFAK